MADERTESIASQGVSAAQKSPPAQAEQPPAENAPPPDVAERIRVIKIHPDEREYQRLLRRGAWITTSINSAVALFTGLGAIFTGVAAVYAYFAWDEYHRQADAAEEQTRPWVQVANAHSMMKSDWQNAEGQSLPPLYTITVDIKNVGNYVSRHTVALGEMFTSYGPASKSEVCADEWKPRSSDTPVMFEHKLLFAGETATLSLSPVNRLSQTPRGKQSNLTPVTVLVKGCVNYQDAKGRVHHTHFTFDLGDNKEGILRPPFFIEQLSDAD